MNLQRVSRIKQMLAQRQAEWIVCMKQVPKPVTFPPIVPTANTVGIHQRLAIWPQQKLKTASLLTVDGCNWPKVTESPSSGEVLALLKVKGMKILATHLATGADNMANLIMIIPSVLCLGKQQRNDR